MKKLLPLLMLSFILCFFLPLSAYAKGEAITSKEQLNSKDKNVGVSAGSASMLMVEKELPEANVMYFEMNEGLEALAQGKIDAYVYDRRQMQIALDSGRKGVKFLGEDMEEKVHIAVGISPVSKIDSLESRLNAFIDELKDDGTIDDMYNRWVEENDFTMPPIEYSNNTEMTLIVGTTGVVAPYSFYKGDELYGFDIELAYRLAAYLNAKVEFKVYDYGSIVPAAATGDVDCIMANLNITPERAQALPFSQDLYTETIGIMVRSTGGNGPEYTEYSDLKGKTVSMLTGAPFEELVKSYEPEVAEFTFYNNMPDMMLGLKSHKTDAILQNNAIATLAANRDPDLCLFPKPLKEGTFGIAFQKGNPELEKWQKARDDIPDSTVTKLWNEWTGTDESVKVVPEQDWPGTNGKVYVACCDSVEPMSYIGQNGDMMGFDVEMILLMAKELDVTVEFVPMEFQAELSYVQSGKALMGIGSIIITDERKEAVDFVEYYPAAFVLLVRTAKMQEDTTSFWEDIRESFDKTFIRENRWRLFVRGVLTTLVITCLSIIFGTILGFLLFNLCRRGNIIANGITGACIKLVQGMPMVVLLMILYYIVFGKISVDGIVVSIVGFTLTFGSGVFGLLKMGVGAVDPGQYEAAYALGYPDRKIFFKIILPQALPHVMGAYKGEIVNLIKATAIVGYIAVQDLTKIGDIVRSRTYDAFFPLIAIAVIYFVLEWLIGLIINRISLTPKKNAPVQRGLLKGVKLHD